MVLDVEGAPLRLFTAITTLGTPLDALLQELRIESFFPADDESEEAFTRLLEAAGIPGRQRPAAPPAPLAPGTPQGSRKT